MPYMYVPRRGASVSYAASIIAKLAAYWLLDEASGANRADATGNGNTAVNTGTVGQGSEIVAANATWDGSTSNYLLAADSATLSMANIDFGLFGWFSLTNVSAARVLVSKGNDAGSAAVSEYIVQASATVLEFYVSNGTTRTSIAPAPALSATTLYFFVAWFDATADTINIQLNNGTVYSTAHTDGGWDGPQTLSIGKYNNFAGGAYLGAQAGLGIYKGLLSAAERTFLYNGGTPLLYPF